MNGRARDGTRCRTISIPGRTSISRLPACDVWQRADGENLYTFTIITTDADEFMAKLHNRMLVILARELEDAWLDPELTKAPDVLDILSHSTGLELDAYPVSRMVNKPSVDSELLIQPVE
jgi:putative SOS response-associated peptidase YedK